MAQLLQAGGNLSIGAFSGTVIINHDIDPRHDINLTAFLLTEAGKVQGDSGIVFFNQPREPNGAAIFIAPVESGNTKTHRIDFDLRKIPAGINKIAITLTEDNRNTFATVNNLKAEVRLTNEVLQLIPNGFNTENGIIVSELYIRNEQPKVRAVWQGFSSGLDGLCIHYGIEVAEESNNISPNQSSSNLSDSSSSSATESLGLLERVQSFLGFETTAEKRARLERERILSEEMIKQEEETKRQHKEQRRANLMARYGDIAKVNQLETMIDRYGNRLESIIDKHNGNVEVLRKIMNKELWVGQTKMQLLDSKGNPVDKDQKIMATKTRETWKYYQVGVNRFRLKITLENDVVVGWEEK